MSELDRMAELAKVFARLRWAVGGEWSVMITPEQAELLLDALEPPKTTLKEPPAVEVRA